MYDIAESQCYKDVWHVERFDDEGCCEMAVFSGPGAEARAREYLAWKNS